MTSNRIVAQNRKARHEYTIEDTLEAGIALTGTEVKSARTGKISINESFASNIGNELFLFHSHIAEYEKASNLFNHEQKRPRKLLLHKNQLNKLLGKIKIKGYTLVPLSIYFNNKNKLKVELAVAKGKQLFDKRAAIKEREWKIEKARHLREK
ncbi:MAG: SsrA-binding protein SmpB [Pseudomonadota bacterium]|mgnify:CR=1 FL=1